MGKRLKALIDAEPEMRAVLTREPREHGDVCDFGDGVGRTFENHEFSRCAGERALDADMIFDR